MLCKLLQIKVPHELQVLRVKILSFLKNIIFKEGRKKTPSVLLLYPEKVLMVGHTARGGWKEECVC